MKVILKVEAGGSVFIEQVTSDKVKIINNLDFPWAVKAEEAGDRLVVLVNKWNEPS